MSLINPPWKAAVDSFVAGMQHDLPTIVAQILYHEDVIEAWKKKIEKGKYPAHQHEHVQAALFAWQYNLMAWYCTLVFKLFKAERI